MKKFNEYLILIGRMFLWIFLPLLLIQVLLRGLAYLANFEDLVFGVLSMIVYYYFIESVTDYFTKKRLEK